MKKLKLFILASLMIGAVGVGVGCSQGETLAQPTDVVYDIEHELTWAAVDGAKSYLVEIVSVATGETQNIPVKRTSPKVDLGFLAQGDYEIRVKALGRDGEKEGKWSETVYFNKGYETGCVYTLINNDKEYALSKYGESSGTIYIENEYRGKPVTEISSRAFKGYSEIEYVHVGDNVKRIGDNAFYNCKNLKGIYFGEESTLNYIGVSAFQQCALLEEIAIPEGVSVLYDSAFAYCGSLKNVTLHDKLTAIDALVFSDCFSLTNVVIPDSVTFLGSSAFSGCKNLQSVTIGENVSVINSSAFYKCGALTEIKFHEAGNLKTIGNGAFSECTALTALEIPEGVEDVQANAFYMTVDVLIDAEGAQTLQVNSKLANVEIPSTVTHVGAQAFFGTKMYMDAYLAEETLIYADDWVIDASMDARTSLVELTEEDFKEDTFGIADSALSSFAALEGVSLPESVKYIGNSAFRSNKKLREFEAPEESVVSIGQYAFMYCEILSYVVFGDGVETIGEYAFAGCTRLDNTEDNVIIPDTVKEVGNRVFVGTKLEGVKDEDGVIYAGNWVIGCAKEATAVTLREDCVGIATYAFANTGVSTITIPNKNKLSYIMRGAFFHCTRLDMVNLSRTYVEEIGDYAFYACESMSTISLPDTLVKIGRSAFSQCARLSSVDLSMEDLEIIGEAAFFGCTNLDEVTFAKKPALKEIGAKAFYKCESLTEVTIPGTVKLLGDYAFAGCALLKKASIGNQVATIGNYAFANCVALGNVTIAAGVNEIGDYAFYGCKELTRVSIREATLEGEGLKSIGAHAFSGAVKLSMIKLPSTLETIGEQAFRSCASLTCVVIPASVKTMAEHAFYGCSGASFYVEEGVVTDGWNIRWNSSYQPTAWGCVLAEDGSIVSITIGENSLSNTWSLDEFYAPEKTGFSFAGWATAADGEVAYQAKEIVNAPVGTTLYAIWSAN